MKLDGLLTAEWSWFKNHIYEHNFIEIILEEHLTFFIIYLHLPPEYVYTENIFLSSTTILCEMCPGNL